MGITSDAFGNGSPSSIRLAADRDVEQIAAIYAPNVTDTIISFESEPRRPQGRCADASRSP